MPKVKISSKNGLISAGGKGLEHLASSGKGFHRDVLHASISMSGTNGSDHSTGLRIPDDAFVEYISIKVTTASIDLDSSGLSAHDIGGFKFGGTVYVLGTAIDCLVVNDQQTILIPQTSSDGAGGAITAMESIVGGGSAETFLTLTETETGFADGLDTAAVVSVLVGLVIPIH